MRNGLGIGFVVGLGVGCVGGYALGVVMLIAGLTVLGASINDRFDEVGNTVSQPQD